MKYKNKVLNKYNILIINILNKLVSADEFHC